MNNVAADEKYARREAEAVGEAAKNSAGDRRSANRRSGSVARLRLSPDDRFRRRRSTAACRNRSAKRPGVAPATSRNENPGTDESVPKYEGFELRRGSVWTDPSVPGFYSACLLKLDYPIFLTGSLGELPSGSFTVAPGCGFTGPDPAADLRSPASIDPAGRAFPPAPLGRAGSAARRCASRSDRTSGRRVAPRHRPVAPAVSPARATCSDCRRSSAGWARCGRRSAGCTSSACVRTRALRLVGRMIVHLGENLFVDLGGSRRAPPAASTCPSSHAGVSMSSRSQMVGKQVDVRHHGVADFAAGEAARAAHDQRHAHAVIGQIALHAGKGDAVIGGAR